MEYFIFFGVLIAFCAADISLKKDPPYKPSGWRPSGLLPGEYGAPPIPASVQVSQENLRFAGQLVEVTTDLKPKNAYLPPPVPQQRFRQWNAAQVLICKTVIECEQKNNIHLLFRCSNPTTFSFGCKMCLEKVHGNHFVLLDN